MHVLHTAATCKVIVGHTGSDMERTNADEDADIIPDSTLLANLFSKCPELQNLHLTALYQIGSRVYFTDKKVAILLSFVS